jgi:dynein heavy chain
LAEKRAKLKAVQDKLDTLERTYQEKVDFEANLQAKIDEANLKLYRANKIIEGLSGEKDRWEETVKKLTRDQGFLIGNCLVGAGLMAYGGAFTAQYRMRLEECWRVESKKRNL